MNLLPSHPLADMATSDDPYSLGAALRGEMAVGFGAVDRQFGELKGEMTELKGELATRRSGCTWA